MSLNSSCPTEISSLCPLFYKEASSFPSSFRLNILIRFLPHRLHLSKNIYPQLWFKSEPEFLSNKSSPLTATGECKVNRQEVLQVLLQQFLNGTEGISASLYFCFAFHRRISSSSQMRSTGSDPLTGVPLRLASADPSVLGSPRPPGSVQCVVL